MPNKLLFAAALLLIVASAAQGQDPLEQELTVAAISSRVAAVEASTTLDATAKAAAKKQLEEARDRIQQAGKSRAAAEELERLAAASPALLKANQAELARPAPEAKPTAPANATLAELERLRGAAESDLKALRDELDALKKESTERSAFLQGASERISNAATQLSAAEEAVKGRGTIKGLGEVANRLNALARRRMLAEEVRRLKSEQASYLARRDLLQSRLDLLGRRIRNGEALVAAWQELESKRRRSEIEAKERDARKAAQNELVQSLPALRKVTDRITELSQERGVLEPELQEALRAKTVVEKRLAELREQFSVTRRKVETAGVTNALGLVLRRQLGQLPNAQRLGNLLSNRQEAISNTQYRLITVEEERAKPNVADLDLGLREIMASVPARMPEEDRKEIEQIARKQLKARRESLDALKADLESHLQTQADLDLTGRRLRDASIEYRTYLEEQILWVPSLASGTQVSPEAVWVAADWLLRSPEWSRTWVRVWEVSYSRLAVLILALFLLVLIRGRARRGLEHSGGAAWKVPRASVPQTLRATVYTTLLAAPLPLATWGLGMILAAAEAPTPVAAAFGAGLQHTGLTWFVLEMVRQSLRNQGLGQSHFRWPSTATGHLRWHLAWLIPVLLVTKLVSTALDAHDHPGWNESLGRLMFLVEMLALSAFWWRVLRPEGPLMARLLRRSSESWLHRLRYVWYPLAVGSPLTFAILAIRGYYYTAQQLEGRLQMTLALLLALGLLEALLERWLRLGKLRLVVRPDGELTAPSTTLAGEAPNGLLIDPLSGAVDRTAEAEINVENDEDLTSSRLQTQKLFRSMLMLGLILGAFAIWGSHLPALRRLERIQVWPHPGEPLDVERVRYPTLEGPAITKAASAPTSAGEGGSTSSAPPMTPTPTPSAPDAGSKPEEKQEGGILTKPLSLAGLGLAIVLIVFMLVASKNLPGLVDIILSQRSSLDAGTRFAASAVLRYVILAVGIGAALSTIGLRWNSVQWLVAALTFGLAFGLQEIFANFVSGLIILFERPIRIGDWVTIGDVSGIVTRIRIRATTVTDWDRKDLIIPNKTFVTGNIVNWALSDAVMRIQVPVGVSYGSNVPLVRQTLLEIAHAHPDVLATPEPKAHFLAFADSCLSFELRAFVSHPSKSMATKNKIFDQIDVLFRERGIEIAFPQRDLHLKSLPDSGPPDLAELLSSTDDAGT